MSQLLNQFSQSAVKGLVDLQLSKNTFPCVVKSDESTPLVPGQGVKIADVAGGAIVVTALTADTDKVFGYVAYNLKDSSFAAGSFVEVASGLAVMYLEASAAIARGAEVMPVITGSKVATATAGKSIAGHALDKAAADGDLIRVLIKDFSEIKEGALITQPNIAELDQTISGSYDQAEVQAISDKVDAILAALVLAGVIEGA